MRARLFALGSILLAAGCGGSAPRRTQPPPPPRPTKPVPPASSARGPVDVKLFARTHTPKAGARWRYRVVATDQRHRKLAGRITVQIVDPLGRAHPVQYGNTKRNITRMPFRGTFSDFAQFPSDARGYRLTLRVHVSTAKGNGSLTYAITPR